MTIHDTLAALEEAMVDERNRLAREAAALDAVAAGQCALALSMGGFLPAFIVGLRRFCAAVDFVEAETRRDALLTAIQAIEDAAAALPSIADMEDPERQARALDAMRRIAAALPGLSGMGDFVDDVAQSLKEAADDARDLGEGFSKAAIGLGIAALALAIVTR